MRMLYANHLLASCQVRRPRLRSIVSRKLKQMLKIAMDKKVTAVVKRKEVNIDNVLQMFAFWQQKHSQLINENHMLKQEGLCLRERVSIYSLNENILQEEITNMRKVQNTFRETIEKKCTIEEENLKLKETIKRLQRDKELTEQKMLNMQSDYEGKVTAKKLQADEILSETTAKLKEEYGQVCNSLRGELRSAEEEKDKLMKEIEDLKKEKFAEITKLRLKYDAKLLHLQQEAAKAQQHAKTPSNVTATHIFRQKYINIKQATEKEIQSLKQTIAELEKRLEQTQNRGPTVVKKRRF